jgi:hypothetical protein
MSESDTETLFEEPISPTPRYYTKSINQLGKRGLEWNRKLVQSIASKLKITRFKALGWTRDEIAAEDPGYVYDVEYHELPTELGSRRTRSCSDLQNAVGTVSGYSAWEYY